MSDIAAKIAKIIAKADSTTSQTEAETFMAKAHALMEAHGISLLDLGRLDQDDPLGHDRGVYNSSDAWKDKIAFELARYYGAEVITTGISAKARTYTVFGRQSARITFTLMMPFVVKQVAKIALAEHAAGRYHTPRAARVALANAMAVRLARLTRDNRARTTEARGAASANALVPVDMIQAEIDSVFDKVRMAKHKYDHDLNAARKAETISLNQQTPAPKSALKLGAA